MKKSADCRRGRMRRGFLTTATVGSLCLGMLATSFTGKEILFRTRCLDTELANQVQPAGDVQVAQLPAELDHALAKR